MRGIKRDIFVVPFAFGVVVNSFDLYFSWYIINYLDVGIMESNPLVATSEDKVDMAKSHIVKLASVAIQALFIYVTWKTRRIGCARFEKIGLVSETNKLHQACFSFVLAANSVVFLFAFVWNPLVFVSAMLDFHMLYVHSLISWLFVFIAILSTILMVNYWHYSFLWRYLTDEAKKKHPYLQWPYRTGFMKDEIV